ncbi:unnamed protein product [Didymodactylos carnosus]|uniref:Uncharacterized protein n=1 Tax=Didymodactylos carnosus TaxID=1234261 RepID=A0A8S2ELL4_9BILA|nr:unnamed protein product [Didymodactylos carnosus]CAF4063465.1 unnamed protein product [Didymodactylos carnosus]
MDSSYIAENSPDFPPLGRTSLLSILNVCKASTCHSLQGVNYFVANAGEAFDDLTELVEGLRLDINTKRSITANLKRTRMYLKSDYKLHSSKSSTESYRESQENVFGKRGLSRHITVVCEKVDAPQQRATKDVVDKDDDDNETGSENSLESDEENKDESLIVYRNKIFVHAIEHCTQDSEVVTAILYDVLTKVKQDNPMINRAFVRSDNAGCYHSASTILSVPQISKETKINIERVDFSDPQGGKSVCDRYAAVIKADVPCHSDGVKGVQAFECKLISLKVKTTLSIPKITTINNFGFEKNSLRVHRAWNIGSGKLIQWKDLKSASSASHLHCEDSVPATSTISTSTTTSKNRQSTTASRNFTTAEIHHDIQTSPSKLHECPEEGCIAAFI